MFCDEDYVLGRGMYQYMAILLACNAIGLILAAPIVVEKYYGFCLLPVSELLFRAMGAVSIPAAAICYCMQVRNKLMLRSFTQFSDVIRVQLQLVDWILQLTNDYTLL